MLGYRCETRLGLTVVSALVRLLLEFRCCVFLLRAVKGLGVEGQRGFGRGRHEARPNYCLLWSASSSGTRHISSYWQNTRVSMMGLVNLGIVGFQQRMLDKDVFLPQGDPRPSWRRVRSMSRGSTMDDVVASDFDEILSSIAERGKISETMYEAVKHCQMLER
jgi:hypothetical protein